MKDFAICSALILAAVVVSVLIALGAYAIGVDIGMQGGLIATAALFFIYMAFDTAFRSKDWVERIAILFILLSLSSLPLALVIAIAQPI